jgi:hypothetical protein
MELWHYSARHLVRFMSGGPTEYVGDLAFFNRKMLCLGNS